jgi:predicted NBD/HSP70 family sugar kinase
VKVLVIDIGGNSVKVLATGETEPRTFPSGPALTPHEMVSAVHKLTEDWDYDAVSIGYPGRARESRPVLEPNNLGHGWVRFDFKKALGVPFKLVNDAAMQALGSYRGGTMLFLGLGTGLGTALVVDGVVVPMELGCLSYRRGTYEAYLGLEGLKRLGIAKWRESVRDVVARFTSALELDDVVIGGGNVNKMDPMPPGCRAGDNANAFRGGLLLWKGSRLRRRSGQHQNGRVRSARRLVTSRRPRR